MQSCLLVLNLILILGTTGFSQEKEKISNIIQGLRDLEEYMTKEQYSGASCILQLKTLQSKFQVINNINETLLMVIEKIKSLKMTLENAISIQENYSKMTKEIASGCFDGNNEKLSVEREFSKNNSIDEQELLLSQEINVNSIFSLLLDILSWFLHYKNIEIHSQKNQALCQSYTSDWKTIAPFSVKIQNDLNLIGNYLTVMICKLMNLEEFTNSANSGKTPPTNSNDFRDVQNIKRIKKRSSFLEIIQRMTEFEITFVEKLHFSSNYCSCDRMMYLVNLKTLKYIEEFAVQFLLNQNFQFSINVN